MYDVVIVGAGPVGCRVGELLGKKDLRVLILEEHPEIGKPVQCAGLVSHRIFDLSEISEDVVVNEVEKARFFAHDGNYIELKHKKPVYVIDREKFDKELAKKAQDVGVEIKTTKFVGYKKGKEFLKVKTTKGNFQTKLLVGADGPNSLVARASGLRLPEKILIGMQSTIDSKFNPDFVELWFSSEFAPDFFGWVIPENEREARVGLATAKNVKERFKKFLKRRFDKPIKERNKVAGVIRFGFIDDSVADRLLLVGDAASQVKPFSGGGLIYGLTGAKFAAEACIKCLKEEKYDHQFLKENYDEVWKNELTGSIKKGVLLNKMIHSFSNKKLSVSFSLARKGKVTKLLEFLDMDLL